MFNTTQQPIQALHNNNAYRQARFGYIPLFGLLLANFLSHNVLAKYAPIGALRLSYEPLPWLHKPTHQNTHESYHYWTPDGQAPPLPLGSSEISDQHIHHHHHIPSTTQQQIVNIHERPTEILIGEEDTEGTDQTEATSPVVVIDDNPSIPMFKNSLEKPLEESTAVESRSLPQLIAFLTNSTAPLAKKVKRGTSRYTKPRKNNKYISQKKKRPTSTTSDYYYDSYEDATTTRKYQPNKRTHTHSRRPVVDSYEESESSISQSYSDLSGTGEESDYGSYELTTKPHKKRRRPSTAGTTNRPKKVKTKYGIRKRQKLSTFDDDEFDDVDYDTESNRPTTTTESLKLRHQEFLLRQQEHLQRQQESLLRQQEFFQRQQNRPNATTTTEEPTSSTTEGTTLPNTIVLNGNVTTNTTNTTGYGYGYGPSNGYESISITTPPPSSGVGAFGTLPSGGGGVVSSGGFSPSYPAPSASYGAPPAGTYGVPSNPYAPGPPNPKPSYGPPSPTYGVPGAGGGGYNQQGYYQLPFNDWYSNEVSRNSLVKKVQDIIGFDQVFQ